MKPAIVHSARADYATPKARQTAHPVASLQHPSFNQLTQQTERRLGTDAQPGGQADGGQHRFAQCMRCRLGQMRASHAAQGCRPRRCGLRQ